MIVYKSQDFNYPQKSEHLATLGPISQMSLISCYWAMVIPLHRACPLLLPQSSALCHLPDTKTKQEAVAIYISVDVLLVYLFLYLGFQSKKLDEKENQRQI